MAKIANNQLGVEAAAPKPFDAMGAPGIAIYNGWIVETEKDPTLQGREKYVTFANIIANTSIVAAGVRYFLDLIAKAGWKAEPADESEEAEEKAEEVEKILHGCKTPWHRIVRRAALFRFYGFGIQEWVAKRDKETGVIGFLDVLPRAQASIEQWDTDETGEVVGVVQRDPKNGAAHYLPREKLVYLVDNSINDSPEGLGLLRHCARPAARLEAYELLESWGFQTDLRGIPIARAPLAQLKKLEADGKLSSVAAQAYRSPMERFISSHNRSPSLGMLLDSSTWRSEDESRTPSSTYLWSVELLKGEGAPLAEAAAAIERLNREIARVLGVEQLLLGADSKGSHALAEDKTQTFGVCVESTLQDMAAQFGKDLVEVLFRLNGWNMSLVPKMKTDTVQYRDVRVVTGALTDLAQAGAPIQPGDEVVNDIRNLLGLREAPEMEEDLAMRARATAFGLADPAMPQDETDPNQEPEPS